MNTSTIIELFFVIFYISLAHATSTTDLIASLGASEAYVTLPSGLTVRYVQAGEHTNAAVVLLHGFPDFWYGWRYQIPPLSEKYHVIAPDLRGYGETDHPSYLEDYAISYLVDDVIDLIDTLNLKDVHLVGHDWGALVAWATAFLHPERFRSVTGMSVPYWLPMPTVQELELEYSEYFYIPQFQIPGVAERMFRNATSFYITWFWLNFPIKEPPSMLIKDLNAGIELTKTHPEYFSPKETFTETDLQYYAKTFKKKGFVGPLNYYRNWNKNAAYLNKKSIEKGGWDLNIPSLTISVSFDLEMLQNPNHIHSPHLKQPTHVHIEDTSHFMQMLKHEQVTIALLEFLQKVDTQEELQKDGL